MLSHCRRLVSVLYALLLLASPAHAQSARVTEETRVLRTYPFSDPNPVPILISDERLYPYHSFEGYAHDPTPREWKVVRLENDYVEVYVLPEVGGKVWGAIVKATGHEFIYRNEVMKFRNISLRGPWTSGGIEFNFGVIGHSPATATPVDYLTRENADGSASVFVGGMDLPSRTNWRVEIRLPADRAYFETRVLWHNPTPLERPYYNWMTAAAFARDDLEMSIPGNAYLEHPGAERAWPDDASGRHLPAYAQGRFGGNKSYHVVGELSDLFGGYYHSDEYGFGHWSRYEDMPGQKLWVWALSRQGGIWEDLLTDSDGQYIEFQAGRLFVQYSPGADVNPISQVGFDPGATDRWTETWFPVEGLGGLTDASRDGAMFVERMGGYVTVRAHAFGAATDTLRLSAGGRVVAVMPLRFETLEPVERTVEVPADEDILVELPALGLRYDSDRTGLALARPFSTDAEAMARIPEVDQLVVAARQAVRGRELSRARGLFQAALTQEPWNRGALLGLADLEYRRGLYDVGLERVDRVLQLDAYDAAANFSAGNLYRALRRDVDATEAFGWAARSMAFRSVAYVQLAELALLRGEPTEAARYADLAIDYDQYNLSARQLSGLVARRRGDTLRAQTARREILEIDPLHHFVSVERYIEDRSEPAARTVLDGLRGEYPGQELLELAIAYVRRGAPEDALELLRLGDRRFTNPLLGAWRAWLAGDRSALAGTADPTFVFPYRRETIPVLEWVVDDGSHWSWRYLLALNLWARDRRAEAVAHFSALGLDPDYAPAYVARAHVLAQEVDRDPESDLRRAVKLDADDRLLRIHLVQHLQSVGRWQDALAVSDTARADFPDDFNLDLLHVRSLNELGHAEDAIEILDKIRVLPSEHASASHQLFEQAHTLAAQDALERDEREVADRHLRIAVTWPERLGQGRPYEPEERLVRYLLGLVARSAGNADASRAALESVVDASGEDVSDRRDLLAISALVALERTEELGDWLVDETNDLGRLAGALVRAVGAGEELEVAVARLAPSFQTIFDDVEGRLLLRAMMLPR